MATIEKLRSRIPSNRALRQKQFCLARATEYRALGDAERERNALSWAENFQREHDAHEESDRLIHYRPVPAGVCERKDSKADERTETIEATGATITESASASHLENVDCIVCRRWARQNPRRTWRCGHGVLLTQNCQKCNAEHDEFIDSVLQEHGATQRAARAKKD